MVRVVLGSLDTTRGTVSHVGSRVMMLGGSLLLDGRRLAYKSTSRPLWLDEHGRAWDTIDFEAADVVHASARREDETAETGTG